MLFYKSSLEGLKALVFNLFGSRTHLTSVFDTEATGLIFVTYCITTLLFFAPPINLNLPLSSTWPFLLFPGWV